MRRLLLLVALASAPRCFGALPDEIEVFDDVLAEPRRTQTTLHLNTSPSGRVQSDFQGEIAPNRAWRMMIELARGMTDGLELGLHIPFLVDRDGKAYAAGLRPRLRWVPKRPLQGAIGPFYGINLEYSDVGARFERPRRHFEVKPIVGWRGAEWLFAANPTLTAWLSDRPHPTPDFSFNAMMKRKVSDANYVGVEYYGSYGPIGNFFAPERRDRALFLAADFTAFRDYRINLGIGRGLTPHSDHTILKVILTLPY